MPVLIKSKIDVKQFPSIRAWRAAMTAGHAAQGQEWHQKMLPKHFTREARTRYGYKPRTEKYQRRKMRGSIKGQRAKYMGMVDLVVTGDLEHDVRGFATYRAFPSRVTVAMNGPSYLRINYKANRPNLAQEIIATTKDEEQRLAEVMDAEVTKHMNRDGESRVVQT